MVYPRGQNTTLGTCRLNPAGPVPRNSGEPDPARIESRLFILQGTLQRFQFAGQPLDLPSQIVLLAALTARTEVGVPDVRTTARSRPEVGAVSVRLTIAAGAEVRVPSIGAAATARAGVGLATVRTAVMLSIEAAGTMARTPLSVMPVVRAAPEVGMVPMVRTAVCVGMVPAGAFARPPLGMVPVLRATMGLGVMPTVVAATAAIKLRPAAVLAIALRIALAVVVLALGTSKLGPIGTPMGAKAAELVRTAMMVPTPGRATTAMGKAAERRTARATVAPGSMRAAMRTTRGTTVGGMAVALVARLGLRLFLAVAVFLRRAGFTVAIPLGRGLGSAIRFAGAFRVGLFRVGLATLVLGSRGLHFVKLSGIFVVQLGLDRLDLALRFAQFALELLQLFLRISVLRVSRTPGGQRRRKRYR